MPLARYCVCEPENAAARRTLRHWTSGRLADAAPPGRESRYDGSQLATPDDATTVLFRSRAVASASLVVPDGCSNGSALGTCEEATIRAVWPTRRAATYAPSSVSVRTTRSAPGWETSTSVRTDCDGAHGLIRAAKPGSGSAQKPPRETTNKRSPCSSSSWLHPASSFSVSSRYRPRRVLTSTELSTPFATAKSVVPFVFTMSGSSTPCSWTFVPE